MLKETKSALAQCQADKQVLLDALGALLRQSADPDPIHPAYRAARASAASVYALYRVDAK